MTEGEDDLAGTKESRESIGGRWGAAGGAGGVGKAAEVKCARGANPNVRCIVGIGGMGPTHTDCLPAIESTLEVDMQVRGCST